MASSDLLLFEALCLFFPRNCQSQRVHGRPAKTRYPPVDGTCLEGFPRCLIARPQAAAAYRAARATKQLIGRIAEAGSPIHQSQRPQW